MVKEIKGTIKNFFGSKELMVKEAIQKLEEDSRIGALLEDIMRSAYPALEQYVLDEIKSDAFKTFQKVDPADELAIIETQMMAKVIDEIKRRIEAKIQQGRLAQETIKSTLLPEEDL